MLTNRAFRRRQRGASLVELALVLFILLLILAAIVDFGRVFNHYVVITNASREGAREASRAAIVPELDLEAYKRAIEDAVRGEVKASSVDPEGLDIIIEPDPYPVSDPDAGTVAPPGGSITVTVTYTVRTIIADIAGFGELPLRARTAMRIYGLDE
ncbi:MAG: TadE/TadG family type IV pilus assembly protein [Chloroflexota bacterium]|nr:TadE/TadG family type IV pilus assembly protein [Chloroflexota bacterium]